MRRRRLGLAVLLGVAFVGLATLWWRSDRAADDHACDQLLDRYRSVYGAQAGAEFADVLGERRPVFVRACRRFVTEPLHRCAAHALERGHHEHVEACRRHWSQAYVECRLGAPALSFLQACEAVGRHPAGGS